MKYILQIRTEYPVQRTDEITIYAETDDDAHRQAEQLLNKAIGAACNIHIYMPTTRDIEAAEKQRWCGNAIVHAASFRLEKDTDNVAK